MASRKSSKQRAVVRTNYFRLAKINIPLTDLPAPERCPFCGCRDIEIRLEQKETTPNWMATAWCEGCGCEAAATSSDTCLRE